MPKKATQKKPKPPRFFRHFDTTIPKFQPCARCGCWLAAGVSEGIHVKVGLVALDLVQQQIATIGRLRLYALTRTGLVELDRYRLRDPKFGARYAEHRCDIRWESRLPPGGPVGIGSTSDVPLY